MKRFSILVIIILGSIQWSFSQGEFLLRGQSGFSGGLGFSTNRDARGLDFLAGYSYRGILDANLSYVKENGAWTSMYNFAGLHTSLWIDPVIRYDSLALISTDTSLIKRSSNTVIYPNPAKDIIYVMTRDNVDGTTKGICNVKLYSSIGQLISTTEGKIVYQSIPIDLHSVNSGVYFLRISYPDETETQKIIVNK